MNSDNSGVGCVIVVIIAVLTLMFSCSSCGSSSSKKPSSGMSDSEFSERAKALGVTTKEYRDTFNYFYYGNP